MLERVIKRMKNEHWLVAYLFIAPVVILFALFRIYPMIFSFSLSLMDWDLFTGEMNWVGMKHYLKAVTDADFFHSFRITLVYSAAMVPVSISLGLALALLLNQKIPGRALFRAAFFLPVITSLVASAVIWRWLYEPNYGMFNAILRRMGLPTSKWVFIPDTALISVIIFGIWQRVGWAMIIFLAGLQAIPQQYYEAAKIDGADKFRCFTSITLPLLLPTTFFITIITTIFSLRTFASIYTMTRGGPMDATLVMVLYIYRVAFSFFKFSYAATLTLIFFLFILVISLIEMRVLGKR